jgi:chromate transporter
MTLAEWLALLGRFMAISPLAVGGGLTVAPDVHRLLVSRLALLDDAQFSASIAIAQAAPGPNVLYVAVAGYQAAGPSGAAAALVGIMLPSSLLTLAVAGWVQARPDRPVVRAFKTGMSPITIALLLASSWILTVEAPGWRPAALTVAVALVFWRTRVHLLWLMAAGALLGAAGWI